MKILIPLFTEQYSFEMSYITVFFGYFLSVSIMIALQDREEMGRGGTDIFVMTKFVMTKVLLQQACFCHDKRRVLSQQTCLSQQK